MFFLQAEDGIRDGHVTGVQTCALPICGGFGDNVVYAATKHALYALADGLRKSEQDIRVTTIAPGPTDTAMFQEIGRASCREGEETSQATAAARQNKSGQGDSVHIERAR